MRKEGTLFGTSVPPGLVKNRIAEMGEEKRSLTAARGKERRGK
jgi:hypothetical protein